MECVSKQIFIYLY